jgi:hypothetical protein
MNKIIEKSSFYSEVFMQEDGIIAWKSTQFNRRLDVICFNYFFQLLMKKVILIYLYSQIGFGFPIVSPELPVG